MAKNLSHLAFAADIKGGEDLPCCFSSHATNKSPLSDLSHIFVFCCDFTV